MAIFKSKDNSELIVTCKCGCDDGLRIKVDVEDMYNYAFITYTKGKFYSEQDGVFSILARKLRKIWAIIWNKDYCYSEILMNKHDFERFREYVNEVDKVKKQT